MAINVNNILSKNKITDFVQVLKVIKAKIGPLNISIDGGAGSGETAKNICKYTNPNGLIYAFEPFPGNHRFFSDLDPRIKLVNKALYNNNIVKEFTIPSVVSKQDKWAEKGLLGYSSLGYIESNLIKKFLRRVKVKIKNFLRSKSPINPQTFLVDCIKLDTFLKEEYIDFIKLDLQGGEYHALQGMREYISRTKFLWIEYSGDYRILKFLKKNNFSLFDTNYMCLETNDKELTYLGLQKISSQILSTSKEAIIAIRNKDKNNFSYNNWLLSARKKGIVQTDLLAINKSLIGDQKELIDLMCTK
tara:strand:+ start:893 stop:1801 length:909 start_codon:yes stop_codon:yes gene_type:complete